MHFAHHKELPLASCPQKTLIYAWSIHRLCGPEHADSTAGRVSRLGKESALQTEWLSPSPKQSCGVRLWRVTLQRNTGNTLETQLMSYSWGPSMDSRRSVAFRGTTFGGSQRRPSPPCIPFSQLKPQPCNYNCLRWIFSTSKKGEVHTTSQNMKSVQTLWESNVFIEDCAMFFFSFLSFLHTAQCGHVAAAGAALKDHALQIFPVMLPPAILKQFNMM